MKKFILAILAVLSIFLFSTEVAFGDEASSSAVQKYHISFPIAELGNCNSLDACKAYCDNSQNTSACQAYASSHGFAANTSSIAQAAKTQLGCDYPTGCREFCAQTDNHSKCEAFAQQFKLTKPNSSSPNVNSLLQKAQNLLGCNSVDTCKAACSQPQNLSKCASLIGGISQPTGLSTANIGAACSSYCSANPQACQNSAPPNPATTSGLVPPAPGNISTLERTCKLTGCTWSNFTCTCQPPTNNLSGSPLPTVTTTPNPVPPQVKGVSTGPSFLENLLNKILGR